eukprot:gene7542-691_t
MLSKVSYSSHYRAPVAAAAAARFSAPRSLIPSRPTLQVPLAMISQAIDNPRTILRKALVVKYLDYHS